MSTAILQGPGPLNHVVRFYRNNIFTVDDGPARHMDDPVNLDFINSVSKGECPQELDPGTNSTEVTVNLLRVEEDYELPKYVSRQTAGRQSCTDCELKLHHDPGLDMQAVGQQQGQQQFCLSCCRKSVTACCVLYGALAPGKSFMRFAC